MYGAHLPRNGAALILERMMSRGWVTHLAANGAGTIHDWEYAWLGRSAESVEKNVATGSFGAWDETGRNIHLALLAGASCPRIPTPRDGSVALLKAASVRAPEVLPYLGTRTVTRRSLPSRREVPVPTTAHDSTDAADMMQRENLDAVYGVERFLQCKST